MPQEVKSLSSFSFLLFYVFYGTIVRSYYMSLSTERVVLIISGGFVSSGFGISLNNTVAGSLSEEESDLQVSQLHD